MSAIETHLLIIDPQNDFCDLPPDYRPRLPGDSEPVTPALPVAGAHADMLRLAELIRDSGQGFTQITVTLDSHQHFDIGHPTFWQHGDGSALAPFTRVDAEDVRERRIVPRRPELFERVLGYLQALEVAGRYRHMIWPIHCEIGTWGHNLHSDVRRAYNLWEERTLAVVQKVFKGTNPLSEHYSAVEAEVPDPDDPGTQLNRELIASLARAERVYIAGEASSHCVKATTEHLVRESTAAERRKLTLIQDCMSPVAGFEQQQDQFYEQMRSLGVRLLTASQVLTELRALAPSARPEEPAR